jgi:hypothetical protein
MVAGVGTLTGTPMPVPAEAVAPLGLAAESMHPDHGRVSETMCKEVSVSLPLRGDSHDDDIDDYARIA